MKSKKNSKSQKVIVRAVLLGLFAVIAIVLILNRDLILDRILAIGYQPTAEVESIIKDLQLTDLGERILFASRPELQSSEDFNENCPIDADTATLGCYHLQRIYVYDVQNSSLEGIKQAVMAHELLHAAWERLSDGEKNELTPILVSIYEQNLEKFSSHMENYNEETRVDELHSVIGTELSVDNYPEKLKKHYARYFRQQSRIIGFYNQYNDKFEKIENNSRELASTIQQNLAHINELNQRYMADLSAFNKDCEEFNARAKIPNGFASREAFDSERAVLVQRQTRLKATYQEISELIDNTNKLINEYNENRMRSNKLYESIDSKITQPTNL